MAKNAKTICLYCVSPEDAISNTEVLSKEFSEIFASSYLQHIAEWKVSARDTENELLATVQTLTGLKIEYLNKIREQELLCKGMFIEMW